MCVGGGTISIADGVGSLPRSSRREEWPTHRAASAPRQSSPCSARRQCMRPARWRRPARTLARLLPPPPPSTSAHHRPLWPSTSTSSHSPQTKHLRVTEAVVGARRTCSARVPTARRCRLPHARRPGAQPDPRTPPSARSPGTSRRRTSEGLSAHLARHPGGRRAARRRRRPSLAARRRTTVLRAARLVILIFCPLMILPRALMTVPPPPSPCRSRPHLLRLLLLVLLHRAARCS